MCVSNIRGVYPTPVRPPKNVENRSRISRIMLPTSAARDPNQRCRAISPDAPETVVFAHFRFLAIFRVFGPPDPVRGVQTPEIGPKRPFLAPFSPVFRHFSRDPGVPSFSPRYFAKSAKRSGDLFCSTGSCELPFSGISSDFASGARKMDFGVGETAVLARFWPFRGPKRRFWARFGHTNTPTLKITFSGLFSALGAFPRPRPGPGALSATPAPIARHLRARCGVFTAF